jgi:hypothetical protein
VLGAAASAADSAAAAGGCGLVSGAAANVLSSNVGGGCRWSLPVLRMSALLACPAGVQVHASVERVNMAADCESLCNACTAVDGVHWRRGQSSNVDAGWVSDQRFDASALLCCEQRFCPG